MTDNMSEAERAKRAEENAAESRRAIQLADEQRRRDQEAGIPTNPAQLQNKIAENIKKKLENDEFSVVVDDETGQHIPPRPETTE